MKASLLLAATAALAIGFAAPAPVMAQTSGSTIMFRQKLDTRQFNNSLDANWTWQEVVSACTNTCGTGTRTHSFVCQNATDYDYAGGTGYGAPEPDAMCASIGSKPTAFSESCSVYTSCTYDWVKPAVQQTAVTGRVGCGTVHTVYSPYCKRSEGTIMPSGSYAMCSADRPDYDDVASGNPDALGYDRVVVQNGSCTTSDHHWSTSAYGAWSNTCSNAATHTRTVTCVRNYDGATVADSSCDASTRPVSSETQPVYSSCSYSWQSSAWSAPSSVCSTTATQTRAVWCQRDQTVDTVADTFCNSASRPAATQTTPTYSGCTYSATNWSGWVYASTCSSNTTRTNTASTCLRSDGTAVASTECTSRGVAMVNTESGQTNYSSCTYSWQNGAWSASSSTCSSTATQTRAVWCRRDQTSETVPDTSCNASTRPTSSQQVQDYSSCTYSATNWSGWTYASTCSSNTSRTQTAATCLRSDGTAVASSECTGRGISMVNTQTGQTNYSSCSYSWQVGGWSASSNTCSGSATQTRAVWCRRDQTGETVADSTCNASTRPASSQQVADYSTCSYSWQTGGWSGSSSTCSSNATQTRAVWCRRDQTGETVGDTACNAGTRPASSQQVQDYSTCSYSWGPATYTSDWDSHCSGNAYRYIDHSCLRSDGTIVSTAICDQVGVGHRENQWSGVYDGCGYSVGPGWGWSDWNSHCSNNAYREQGHSCIRSDGYVDNNYADNECSRRGMTTWDRQWSGIFDQCSYQAVNPGNWTDWNSHCSGNASRSRHYQCWRSNDGGQIIPDQYCPIGLDEVQTTGVYDGCGYNAVNWSGWSACSNNSQSQTAQCQRSDGAIVANSECNNRGISTYQTQSCSSTPICAAGWGPERIIYSEDTSRGITADQNAAGQCTSGQGGTSASTKGNVSECWTYASGLNLYGRYCGR